MTPQPYPYQHHEAFDLPEPPQNTSLWVMTLADLISQLLAFFILLYTYAEISTRKMEDASVSVQSSFKGPAQASVPTPHSLNLAAAGGEMQLRQYYAQTRKITRELLQLEDAAVIVRGNTMIIRLPVGLLFSGATSQIDDRKLFLRKMTESLLALPFKMQVDAEFTTAGRMENMAPDALTVRRAGAFARQLVAMGMPEEQVYSGITEGTGDMFEITFHPRPSADSKNEF